MTYRVILTYHPEVGTFRPGRGAWRVQRCLRSGYAAPLLVGYDYSTLRQALFMDSPERIQPGTWINPRTLINRSPAP